MTANTSLTSTQIARLVDIVTGGQMPGRFATKTKAVERFTRECEQRGMRTTAIQAVLECATIDAAEKRLEAVIAVMSGQDAPETDAPRQGDAPGLVRLRASADAETIREAVQADAAEARAEAEARVSSVRGQPVLNVDFGVLPDERGDAEAEAAAAYAAEFGRATAEAGEVMLTDPESFDATIEAAPAIIERLAQPAADPDAIPDYVPRFLHAEIQSRRAAIAAVLPVPEAPAPKAPAPAPATVGRPRGDRRPDSLIEGSGAAQAVDLALTTEGVSYEQAEALIKRASNLRYFAWDAGCSIEKRGDRFYCTRVGRRQLRDSDPKVAAYYAKYGHVIPEA